MAWTHFPVNVGDPIRAVHINELRAAAVERGVFFDSASYPAKSPGDPIYWDTAAWPNETHWGIKKLRTQIETYADIMYRDPDNDLVLWNMGTLRTKAIGQADWTDPLVGVGDPIRAIHFNEIYLVLDELRWLKQIDIAFNYGGNGERRDGRDNTGADWDAKWDLAITDYLANAFGAWQNWTPGVQAHKAGVEAAFIHEQHEDYTFTIDEQVWADTRAEFVSAGIDDAKMIVEMVKLGTFTPGNHMHLYQQANYAGAEVNFAASGNAGTEVLDIATPADLAVLHFSSRTSPAVFDRAGADAYEPPEPAPSYRRYYHSLPGTHEIHLKHAFAHQT